MSYYNQKNYWKVPYPHATRPNATVSTSGCGVCAMSMVVEGLTGKKWGPRQAAEYSISIGARASGGTDMGRLGRRAAAKFGLVYSVTSDINRLVEAVQGGAWAIANVGGDRKGYVGLFSDSGHFVAVRGIKAGRLIVWDPMLYNGKFTKKGRAGKVTLEGNDAYVMPAFLDKDCETRYPRYYIFEEEEMTQADFNKMMDNWLASRDKQAESEWSVKEGGFGKLTQKGVMNGEAPRAFVTREELAAVIDRSDKHE